MLYLVCTTIARVDHARYEIPYAQEVSTCICGPCYDSTLCTTGISVICGTGKNINLGLPLGSMLYEELERT